MSSRPDGHLAVRPGTSDRALSIDGEDGGDLNWVLRGPRCVGDELMVMPSGLRLRHRPGTEHDYAAVRSHLERYAHALTAMLRARATRHRSLRTDETAI